VRAWAEWLPLRRAADSRTVVSPPVGGEQLTGEACRQVGAAEGLRTAGGARC
jgi:hypothetical protein